VPKLRTVTALVLLAATSLTPAWAVAQEQPSSASTPASAPTPAVSSVSSSSPSSAAFLGHVPALVTGGAAIVALGVGIVFGALAWSDHEAFQSNPTTSTANRGESEGLTADMCFGGAATLAVVSAVMFFTHEDATAAPQATAQSPRVAVAPFLSAHGGGAGAVVRF